MKTIQELILVSEKKGVYTVTIETTEIDSFGKDYISHKLFDNCREYKLPLVLAQAKNLYKNATIIH